MIVSAAQVLALTGLDSKHTARIEALIPTIEADYLLIRNKAFDVDPDSGNTVYPAGAASVAADMIAYKIRNPEGQGLDSISVEGVNKNFTKKLAGYPIDMVGPPRIKAYAGVH